jgi:hypothetical protein
MLLPQIFFLILSGIDNLSKKSGFDFFKSRKIPLSDLLNGKPICALTSVAALLLNI